MHKYMIDTISVIGRRSEESLLSHPGLLPDEWMSVVGEGAQKTDESAVVADGQELQKAYAHFLYALLIG